MTDQHQDEDPFKDYIRHIKDHDCHPDHCAIASELAVQVIKELHAQVVEKESRRND